MLPAGYSPGTDSIKKPVQTGLIKLYVSLKSNYLPIISSPYTYRVLSFLFFSIFRWSSDTAALNLYQGPGLRLFSIPVSAPVFVQLYVRLDGHAFSGGIIIPYGGGVCKSFITILIKMV